LLALGVAGAPGGDPRWPALLRVTSTATIAIAATVAAIASNNTKICHRGRRVPGGTSLGLTVTMAASTSTDDSIVTPRATG
jgi:hypothetical protein